MVLISKEMSLLVKDDIPDDPLQSRRLRDIYGHCLQTET